jgi:hypothetical protein
MQPVHHRIQRVEQQARQHQGDEHVLRVLQQDEHRDEGENREADTSPGRRPLRRRRRFLLMGTRHIVSVRHGTLGGLCYSVRQSSAAWPQ